MATLRWAVLAWLATNALIPFLGLIVSIRLSRTSARLPAVLRDREPMFEHGPEQRALEAHLAAIARSPHTW